MKTSMFSSLTGHWALRWMEAVIGIEITINGHPSLVILDGYYMPD